MKQLFFLLLICPMLSIAQVPDPIPGTYVQDHTNHLSPQQIHDLNKQLYALDTGYKVSMAVVIVDHIPEGVVIEEYALLVARKWHVGRGGNGLVYVMSVGDKKQRLEVSGHLEYIITDIRAHELTENFKAFYRSGNMFEGFSTMIRSIEVMLKEEKPVASVKTADNDKLAWLLVFAIIVVVSALWLVVVRYKRKLEAQQIKDSEERIDYLRRLHGDFPRSIGVTYGNHPNRHRPIEEEEPQRSVYVAPIVMADREPDRSSSSYATGFSSSSDSGSSYDSGSDFSGGGSTNDL